MSVWHSWPENSAFLFSEANDVILFLSLSSFTYIIFLVWSLLFSLFLCLFGNFTNRFFPLPNDHLFFIHYQKPILLQLFEVKIKTISPIKCSISYTSPLLHKITQLAYIHFSPWPSPSKLSIWMILFLLFVLPQILGFIKSLNFLVLNY